MNYTEMSLEFLKTVSIKAAEKIRTDVQVDLIIFIAKAGFPIALYMNEIFQCQMVGVSAKRKGEELKLKAGFIFSYLPRFVRDILLFVELKSKIHKHNKKRDVYFHDSLSQIDKNRVNTILIVDDSVDSGNTLISVMDIVKETFSTAKIKIYSLNVWKQSKALVSVDYMTYEDTVIRSPMSKDSKEYCTFLKLYYEKTQNEYI